MKTTISTLVFALVAIVSTGCANYDPAENTGTVTYVEAAPSQGDASPDAGAEITVSPSTDAGTDINVETSVTPEPVKCDVKTVGFTKITDDQRQAAHNQAKYASLADGSTATVSELGKSATVCWPSTETVQGGCNDIYSSLKVRSAAFIVLGDSGYSSSRVYDEWEEKPALTETKYNAKYVQAERKDMYVMAVTPSSETTFAVLTWETFDDNRFISRFVMYQVTRGGSPTPSVVESSGYYKGLSIGYLGHNQVGILRYYPQSSPNQLASLEARDGLSPDLGDILYEQTLPTITGGAFLQTESGMTILASNHWSSMPESILSVTCQ